MSEESKKIEVVNGNGQDLEISEVSTHLSGLKPKNKEEHKQEIVIPEAKKKCCNKNSK